MNIKLSRILDDKEERRESETDVEFVHHFSKKKGTRSRRLPYRRKWKHEVLTVHFQTEIAHLI